MFCHQATAQTGVELIGGNQRYMIPMQHAQAPLQVQNRLSTARRRRPVVLMHHEWPPQGTVRPGARHQMLPRVPRCSRSGCVCSRTTFGSCAAVDPQRRRQDVARNIIFAMMVLDSTPDVKALCSGDSLGGCICTTGCAHASCDRAVPPGLCSAPKCHASTSRTWQGAAVHANPRQALPQDAAGLGMWSSAAAAG